jgi:hypothetical protein
MLDRTDRLGLIETFKVVCPFPHLLAASPPCTPQLKWNVADEQLGSTGNVYVNSLTQREREKELMIDDPNRSYPNLRLPRCW